jgi:hypothetical protein
MIMKAVELATKLCISKCEFAPEETVDSARTAFLANLTAALKIEFPENIWGREDSLRTKLFFYVGVLTGFQGEITEDRIKEAHLAMLLPSNRAIISRLLYGEGDVTQWGTPANYNVT